MDPVARLRRAHARAFGAPPELVASAPGRVNLIGEHTDYNDGFVLPMTIERRVWAAASVRTDRRLGLHSLDSDARSVLRLDALAPGPAGDWTNYPAGVVAGLIAAGAVSGGLDLTVTGEVPQGAGLSSSAALEIACGLAACALSGVELPGAELARVAQQAEHEFCGVRCGIMDQLISRLAVEGAALLIDCRDLSRRPVQIPADCAVVITDTRSPHKLSASAYNLRRDQCERGVAALQAVHPGTALRDYTLADLASAQGLTAEERARCEHVIGENARVLEAEAALAGSDLTAFGRSMNASHASLRDLYQVTSPELDWLVEKAQATPGVFGSRMTGAGFGGCTVTLLAPDRFEAYGRSIAGYQQRFGRPCDLLVTRPAPGARVDWRRLTSGPSES